MSVIDTAIAPGLFDLPPHLVTSGTIYHDAWCTPYLCIHFPDLIGRVRVTVEFWNPAMIDRNPNEVVIRLDHRAIAVFPDLMPEQIQGVQRDVDVGAEGGLVLSIRSAGRCPQLAHDIRPLALVIRNLTLEPMQGLIG
ncbi:hypothetical protein AWL63_10930 [Sphingomonas panacis]|uniref:Uncharacterized protein n=1 Tax=Sphingomonas panacis TaxID=1560345 RepID=A0A1B3ZAE3_9SPHN|nr:hypothetical protein [Sphingomonas panacis]AOH84404.1 hypothetical protein AWL63_10930 [Sphingomonas panacis]